MEPSTIRDAIDSGDTDRVNEAIDAVEDLDRGTAVERFDRILAVCRDLYGAEDGYKRQATVRVVGALKSVWFPTGTGQGDADDPEEYRVRCWEFLLDAITDDDGRVRRAAIRTMNTLGVAAKIDGGSAELEAATEALDEALSACTDEEVAKHIEEARETVAFHRTTTMD